MGMRKLQGQKQKIVKEQNKTSRSLPGAFRDHLFKLFYKISCRHLQAGDTCTAYMISYLALRVSFSLLHLLFSLIWVLPQCAAPQISSVLERELTWPSSVSFLPHVCILLSFSVSTTSPGTLQKLQNCLFLGPLYCILLYLLLNSFRWLCSDTVHLEIFTMFWWATNTHITTLFFPVGQFWL